MGSLLVGVGFAKSLALGLEKPVVGVHHIEAHVLSNELAGEALQCPCVVLVVSGGHTSLYRVERVGRYELVGNTRDDAAGEAFDKIAKLLGLGFPGGPVVQRAAENRRPARDRLSARDARPRRLRLLLLGIEDRGAPVRRVARASSRRRDVADIAASAQAAIVDVLVERTVACARAAVCGTCTWRAVSPRTGRCARPCRPRARPPAFLTTRRSSSIAPTTGPWWRAPRSFSSPRAATTGSLDVFTRGAIVVLVRADASSLPSRSDDSPSFRVAERGASLSTIPRRGSCKRKAESCVPHAPRRGELLGMLLAR